MILIESEEKLHYHFKNVWTMLKCSTELRGTAEWGDISPFATASPLVYTELKWFDSLLI